MTVKVGETRFNKVKLRQIKKFQNLVNKKEGNITWYSNNNNNLPQAGNNTNRQADTPFPQGRQQPPQTRPLPPTQEGEGPNPTQTGLVSPPRPLLIFLPRKIVIPKQFLTFLCRKEATLSRQVLSFLLVKEAVSPWQSCIFLPRKIAIPRQLLTFLPRKEATLSWQLLSFLPVKEAASPWLLLTFLPRKEAILPWQLLPFLPGKVAILLQLSLPLGKETILPPKQVNPIIKIGQSGKVSGILTGIGQPRLPRRTTLSPGKTIPPLPHLLGPPRIFQ